MESSKGPPHVAIFSSPGAGHLNPLISFSKLLQKHDNSITITIITHSDYQYPVLSSLPTYISSISLPPVSLSDLTPETRIATIMARSVPFVNTILQNLKSSSNLVAYVTDLFGNESVQIAKEVGVPHYMFFTTNLFALSFMFQLPALDETTSCEYRDLPCPLKLPGCVPLRGEDFMSPTQDRNSEAYRRVVCMAKRYRELDGILVNSFPSLEPNAAKIFTTTKEDGLPPVHLIGPVGQFHPTGTRSDCLDFLDRMPRGSVLYISFGSGGTLSRKQTEELALGLMRSRQRFLWVARAPSDSESGAYFGSENKDPSEYLPREFSDVTRDVGTVVPDWAPQVDVLSHAAVGGFMTHCGWNSALESVVNGVPMIAWPLYAEQRMNAVLLADGVEIALRPCRDGDGIIGRDEICRVVRELMEGDEGKAMRRKVNEIKMQGVKAAEEEGTSYEALSQLLRVLTK